MSIEAMKQKWPIDRLEKLRIQANQPSLAAKQAYISGLEFELCQAIAELEKQEPVGALTLGGIIDTSDGPEYENWDVEWDTKAIEALQEKLVTSDRVEVMLYINPQPKREPLTYKEIRELWASENGLEDCDLSKIDDFISAVRFVEAAHGIKEEV